MMTDTETIANTTTLCVPARARRAKAKSTASIAASTARTAPSKSDTVIKLLLRAKGATPMELIAATDWQPHSVRAFLSGLRKKGRTIVHAARKTGEFANRIVASPAPAATETPDDIAPVEESCGPRSTGVADDMASA